MLLFFGVGIFVAVFLLSVLITGKILKYVAERNVLDHPNFRSLHKVPTPRGGGISIVLLVLTCLIIMWSLNYINTIKFSALMIAGLLIFITGLVDDIKSIPSLVKGISYFAGAMWGVYWLSVDSLGINSVGFISIISWSLCISWMTNLYNFMDGSDGFAGVQTLLAGVVLMIMSYFSGMEFLYFLMLVIVASVFGFLFYNFPPARIFMGDSGSCFLGLTLSLVGYLCYINNLVQIEIWLILFSVFICDSSLTLIKRVLLREKWYEAHREHAYQKMILMHGSHGKLLVHFTVLFLVLLFPVFLLAVTVKAYSWYFVILCYVVLTIIWGAVQYRYQNYVRVKRHD